MKQNILIELILNNQCNKRCSYCDLDFRNKKLDKKSLDIFISFLQKNTKEVGYFYINFFGGEPLLSFKELVYFVENVGIKNIQYSVGTNGVLLGEEQLQFCKKHDIKIYLSIDNIDGIDLLKKRSFRDYLDIIELNFINDPDHIELSKGCLTHIIDHGFKNINFMPVFTTKNRNNKSLSQLYSLKRKVSELSHININYFSYYNGFSSDIQFILDTDLFFYKDLDSLIWLQKQYTLVPASLKEELYKKTRLFHIENDIFSVKDLINQYNQEEVLRLVMKIPKVIGTYKQNLLIDKLLKDGTKKR